MNYQKIYNDLVKKAKQRTPVKDQRYDKHHIIPRCLGGTNSRRNIVRFTLREHFVGAYAAMQNSP